MLGLKWKLNVQTVSLNSIGDIAILINSLWYRNMDLNFPIANLFNIISRFFLYLSFRHKKQLNIKSGFAVKNWIRFVKKI